MIRGAAGVEIVTRRSCGLGDLTMVRAKAPRGVDEKHSATGEEISMTLV